jgi:hypothetical protein
MVKTIFGGLIASILLALAFTAWSYLLICLGLHPESADVAGLWAPLLALFCVGAFAGAKSHRWLAGLYPAAAMVLLWFLVWGYLVGRFSLADWGHAAFSTYHLREWGLALLFGIAGSACGTLVSGKVPGWSSIGLALAILTGVQTLSSWNWNRETGSANSMAMTVEKPESDGTVVRHFIFDFAANPTLRLRLYDADSDDRVPFDDSNTSYMGQGIDLVGKKLDRAARAEGAQLLCAFNSGFFGARDHRVAFHEAPVVIDGKALYNVDIIRPKEQAWVFAMSSQDQIREGVPRFRLVPEMPFAELAKSQTALAGVRPLRVDGNSLELKPGIGSTKLRCARTSIGWSADGNTLHVLIVRDPDTEGSSNLQRKGQRTQTGGWDVREVQAFWEKQGIPNAILLDGGESTQAVYRNGQGGLTYLRAGYHWGIPLGHIGSRPIVAFPAMLPRLQNCRGVLNYLYVEAGPR